MAVQGAPDDLLWPLDLQVRGSGAAGRESGADRPRYLPAAYGWNVVESSWAGAQYFVQTPNDGMDQTEANGWVQPVAEGDLRGGGKNLAQLTAAAKQKGFKAVPLGLKVSFSFDNAIRRSVSHNVIGILPGKTRPTNTCSIPRTGTTLAIARPMPRATTSATARSTTPLAWPLAALAKMNRAAGPAQRSEVFLAVTLEESACLDRNTMRATRSIRWRRPWAA
jgi:hypothetical protein